MTKPEPLPLTPEAIARSRPADRVTFTDWERDPDDADPPIKEELVAVAWSLFTVTRYEKRTSVYRQERRKRCEFWDQPSMNVPMVLGPLVASFDEPPTAADIAVRHIPASTVGRSEWEYRRRWVVA